MIVRFEEIKNYIARNVKVSICFEDGYYHDYLMISDIPKGKYDHLYVSALEWLMWNFPWMFILLHHN